MLTVADAGLGVLADVGQALADHVVGGDLGLLVEPLRSRAISSRTGTARGRRQRLERDREAMSAEHGRVQTAGHVTQLVQGDRDLVAALHRCGPGPRGRRARPFPRRPSSSESAISRCWAPSWRLRSSRLRSRWPASITRPRDPLSSSRRALQLGLQLPVLERDRGRGADRVEQLRLVLERRVVLEHRDRALPSRSISVVARSSSCVGEGARAGRRSRSRSRTAAASRRSPARGRGAPAPAARARSIGAGCACSSIISSPTEERARRASRRAIRKPTGASPMTTNVARWIGRKKASLGKKAPVIRSTALITRASENESTSSAAERRSGRPPARRRAASRRRRRRASIAARADELRPAQGWRRARARRRAASTLSGSNPPRISPTSCKPTATE